LPGPLPEGAVRGIGAFTPDSFPVFDRFRQNAYVIADSNHGYKMIGVGELVARELLGEPAALRAVPVRPVRHRPADPSATHPSPGVRSRGVRVLFVQHQADCPPGLVGDRLIELGARLEVADPMSPLPDPAGYQLLVPLGSEHSAADESVPYLRAEWELLAGAVRADVPVFGICFGAQLLCRVLGARSRRRPAVRRSIG